LRSLSERRVGEIEAPRLNLGYERRERLCRVALPTVKRPLYLVWIGGERIVADGRA